MTTSHEAVFLNSFYIGVNIQNILYGIELLLYFETICLLLSNRRARKKSNVFYALFTTTMLFLVTVWVATQAIFGENMWILESNFPGGPYVYWKTKVKVWYMGWGMVAVIILQLMTDALMIHRCRIIWNSNCVVTVPIILWLATLGFGVLVAWTSSSPASNFRAGVAARYGLAYWSVSVFLHATLTCMICYRVVQYGRKIQMHLGKEYASSYFAIVAIIVESVLPYTLSGIAFLVALGVGSPTSGAFICVYLLMMCISPQMLILRVVAGRAWAYETVTFNGPNSTIKFSPPSLDVSGSQSLDNSRARVHLQILSSVDRDLPDGCEKTRISEV